MNDERTRNELDDLVECPTCGQLAPLGALEEMYALALRRARNARRNRPPDPWFFDYWDEEPADRCTT